jgi:tetratricopeptide (TPR) repeat protein
VVLDGLAQVTLRLIHDAKVRVARAIEYHTQDLEIAKEVGDRAGEGRAYGNIGNVYQSQGDFSKAIEHHAQHLSIAKDVGNGQGVREHWQRV